MDMNSLVVAAIVAAVVAAAVGNLGDNSFLHNDVLSRDGVVAVAGSVMAVAGRVVAVAQVLMAVTQVSVAVTQVLMAVAQVGGGAVAQVPSAEAKMAGHGVGRAVDGHKEGDQVEVHVG